MNPFFEISSDDIKQLSDSSLRKLVGLLCEDEFRKIGLRPFGVLWGGHQDAADGGFDVVVEGKSPSADTAYLGRANTGFQVKKPKMPPSKITEEMIKDGLLKPEIKSLAESGGTYIIVSSGDTCSASALKSRQEKMREILFSQCESSEADIDFIDSSRLATWVRSYPGLILWVKSEIGHAYQGWQPFGEWALIPKGGADTYLTDDEVRVHEVGNKNSEGSSALDAIAQLREKHREGGAVTRVSGLSGVGKTRFVQALFEKNVGDYPLDTISVLYADVANSPVPEPAALIEQLIADRRRSVVVLDNCPPELHRVAAKAVVKDDSSVSLISVEYDIREDLPPETNVIRLNPSSESLIKKLVMLHHPHVSERDAESIAGFSGGNARIADALAATVKLGETLSGLRDEELFNRLFYQRHDKGSALREAAELLSLVYSYDGVSLDSESELNVLGLISDVSGRKLYSDTVELIARGLVQSRSKWRAVLPHALSNRLAASALKKYPIQLIENTLLSSDSNRLIASFSRRLGYLHDSDQAIELVESWFNSGGFLGGDVSRLNDLGFKVFENVAPVVPARTLSAIEVGLTRGLNSVNLTALDIHSTNIVRILRCLAYDGDFFVRCCDCILVYALSEQGKGQATDSLLSMFQIVLSGTHASPEVRNNYIRGLIEHSDVTRRAIGLNLLEASLSTERIHSSHSFEFGARPRNFGYDPIGTSAVADWFDLFLSYAMEIALSESQCKAKVRKTIASKLRELWWIEGLIDKIDVVATALHSESSWGEGWIAIRQILHFGHSEKRSKSALDRLQAIERKLRPHNLVDKAIAYTLGDVNNDLMFLDEDEDLSSIEKFDKAGVITREIAFSISNDLEELKKVLVELISNEGSRLVDFGQGLAAGAVDRENLWQQLFAVAKSIPQERRNIDVLVGFLLEYSKLNLNKVIKIIDDLVEDDDLGEYFPRFQSVISFDSSAHERILRALDARKAPIERYTIFAWGKLHENFDDIQLIDLFSRLEREEGGIEVVGEVLKMRFFGKVERSYTQEILDYGKYFLKIVPFNRKTRQDSLHDYDLHVIAKKVLRGEKAKETAESICDRFLKHRRERGVYPWHFPRTLAILAELQPIVFLQKFYGVTANDVACDGLLLSSWFDFDESPLASVPVEDLVNWCSNAEQEELSKLAYDLPLFYRVKHEDREELRWVEHFELLLNCVRDKQFFLESASHSLWPLGGWSGNKSDVLEKRVSLLKLLDEHPDHIVRDWSRVMQTSFAAAIREELKREKLNRTNRDETFE